METFLRVAGTALLIVAVVSAIWPMPAALHNAVLLAFAGVVLLGGGELLTRIGKGR